MFYAKAQKGWASEGERWRNGTTAQYQDHAELMADTVSQEILTNISKPVSIMQLSPLY